MQSIFAETMKVSTSSSILRNTAPTQLVVLLLLVWISTAASVQHRRFYSFPKSRRYFPTYRTDTFNRRAISRRFVRVLRIRRALDRKNQLCQQTVRHTKSLMSLMSVVKQDYANFDNLSFVIKRRRLLVDENTNGHSNVSKTRYLFVKFLHRQATNSSETKKKRNIFCILLFLA